MALSTSLRQLVIVSTCLGLAQAAEAQIKPKVLDLGAPAPRTAIFIGNSFFYYNNSMHTQVLNLVRNADPANRAAYAATSVTISGSGFDWHDVGNYFRPNAIGRYSFDDANNIVFNKRDKLFDIAIMMDCSQCPVHPELKSVFHDFAKKGAEAARQNGAKPVFFMSWAYADKPEMTAQLAEQYVAAGNANEALVIPAGLAFAKSIAKRPDLNLYVADKRHPSPAGTYLAAATVAASVFKLSPVGNAYSAGIDPATARFLQEVAWETVQEFQRE